MELYFTPVTPIHLGGGQEGILKQVVRVPVKGSLTPIIPAESVKGVLRLISSRIAKSMTFNDKIKKIVSLHNKDKHLPEDSSERMKLINELYEKARKILLQIYGSKDFEEELSKDDIVELYLSLLCPICKLYGARSISSKLLIYDLIPLKPPKTSTYTSTSIDRKTGIVSEKKLYSVEFIVPEEENQYYYLKMLINNVEKGSHEAKVFASTINYIIQRGLIVGGLKTRGFGILKLDTEKSKVRILKLNPNPRTDDDIKSNIKALLLKEGHYKQVSLEKYVQAIK